MIVANVRLDGQMVYWGACRSKIARNIACLGRWSRDALTYFFDATNKMLLISKNQIWCPAFYNMKIRVFQPPSFWNRRSCRGTLLAGLRAVCDTLLHGQRWEWFPSTGSPTFEMCRRRFLEGKCKTCCPQERQKTLLERLSSLKNCQDAVWR